MNTGETRLALDLLDPVAAARRLTVEALLEAHGAERGLDPDLWAISTDQADELLADVAEKARRA